MYMKTCEREDLRDRVRRPQVQPDGSGHVLRSLTFGLSLGSLFADSEISRSVTAAHLCSDRRGYPANFF